MTAAAASSDQNDFSSYESSQALPGMLLADIGKHSQAMSIV